MVTRPYDWSPYVAAAATQYGVPPALVSSVIGAESSGRPGAVSSAGAGGLMQLMPSTFAELQQKHGLGPDRMDPETNIQAGTAYLGQLYKQFGNWPDAIAAYNSGPNRWAAVKAGKQAAPAETTDYTKKVLASFGQGQGPTTKEADVPLFGSNRAATEDESVGWMNSAMSPMADPRFANLLDYMPSQNHLDGLGLLGNAGQTPSQPPRTDPAALPGTTQTDRLDLSGRINELIGQYTKQKPVEMPSQLQYMLAGAQKGVQGLAGVHDRPVGIGEMLGALGGGVTSGYFAGNEAQQQQRSNQIGELGNLAKLQGYQRTEATAAAKVQAARKLAAEYRASGDPQKIQIATALEGDPSIIDEVIKAQANSVFPKEGGGFTIGNTRYDAQGRPIVTGKPDDYTVGDTRFSGATNQPIATATKPQTVPLTPDEVAKLGLPPGTVAQRKADGTIDVVPKPPDPTFDNTAKLRTEFTNAAKPLVDMRQMYGRVEAAYQDTTPVGDIALTYGFMKMLDPTSVVREGEYATAQNAAGVPDRIRQQWNALVDGNRLSAGVRADMFKQAQAQFGAIEKQHGELENRYRDLATRQGLKPDDVVIDLRGGTKAPGAAPDPDNPKVGDLIRNAQTGETRRWTGRAWETVR
jgi:hypothetical protein